MSSKADSAIILQPKEVDSIPATEMQNAQSKRLPEILKKSGVAKVTRYGKVNYYIVAVPMFEKLVKSQKRAENAKLKALRSGYCDLVKRMQAPQNKDAFAALSRASGSELGATTKVGTTD